MHIHAHTYNHTHARTHTHTHSLSPSLPFFLSLSLFFSAQASCGGLSFSHSHTHTHTHTPHANTNTYTHTHSLSQCPGFVRGANSHSHILLHAVVIAIELCRSTSETSVARGVAVSATHRVAVSLVEATVARCQASRLECFGVAHKQHCNTLQQHRNNSATTLMSCATTEVYTMPSLAFAAALRYRSQDPRTRPYSHALSPVHAPPPFGVRWGHGRDRGLGHVAVAHSAAAGSVRRVLPTRVGVRWSGAVAMAAARWIYVYVYICVCVCVCT